MNKSVVVALNLLVLKKIIKLIISSLDICRCIFCIVSMITTVDKGWSWVVLIGVFFTSILTFGFLQCLGVFYIDWQEDFGASAQAVGWSSSVFIAGFGLSGKKRLYLTKFIYF